MIISFRSTSRHIVVLAIAAVAIACGRKSGSGNADTASAQGASPGATDTATAVRGTVANVSPTALVIKTDTGSVTVMIVSPFPVYERAPDSLSALTTTSFIGGTTLQQSVGSTTATALPTLPDALRARGDGSRLRPRLTVGGCGSGGGVNVRGRTLGGEAAHNGPGGGCDPADEANRER